MQNKCNSSLCLISYSSFLSRMETLTGTSPLVTLRSWRTVMGSQKTAPASHILTESHSSPLRWWVTPHSFTGKHFDSLVLQDVVLFFNISVNPFHPLFLLSTLLATQCSLPYKSMFLFSSAPNYQRCFVSATWPESSTKVQERSNRQTQLISITSLVSCIIMVHSQNVVGRI